MNLQAFKTGVVFFAMVRRIDDPPPGKLEKWTVRTQLPLIDRWNLNGPADSILKGREPDELSPAEREQFNQRIGTWVAVFAASIKKVCAIIPMAEVLKDFPRFQETVRDRLEKLKWHQSKKADCDIGAKVVKDVHTQVLETEESVRLCVSIPHGDGEGYFTEVLECIKHPTSEEMKGSGI
jgi:hypothetical protein